MRTLVGRKQTISIRLDTSPYIRHVSLLDKMHKEKM